MSDPPTKADPAIRMFIVTYKNRERLRQTLTSLAATTDLARLQLFIINNHSEFSLAPEHERLVTRVYHNSLRPDFSTGHLSRNWNQALINGFEDLSRPACDVVITSQDDVEFQPGWLDKLLTLHRGCSFLQFGAGDELCSYLPEAVINIGIWDEHFCNIGFQEADYFVRAVMFNARRSSINDHFHGRLHNCVDPVEGDGTIVKRLSAQDKHNIIAANQAHQASMKHHSISAVVFRAKYGADWRFLMDAWPPNLRSYLPPQFSVPVFTLYPYFEKDIANRFQKGYLAEKARPADGKGTKAGTASELTSVWTKIRHRLRHTWRVLRFGHLDVLPQWKAGKHE